MKAKKMIRYKLLLCLLVLVLCLTGCSDNKNDSGLIYQAYIFAPGEIRYALISVSDVKVDEVVIPATYKGETVDWIYDAAFEHCYMKSVRMESIGYICGDAFRGCGYLTDVELGCVKEIHGYAFQYCWSLESITIPATIRTIGIGAFNECPKLTAVYFEGVPNRIGDNAFDKTVTIYGPANSKVEEYAINNGLNFCEWYPAE